MALYTPEEITKEIQGDKEYILAQKYPEDATHEYADSACPIYYGEIISTWAELPEEYSNKFHELTTELPDRIETLMNTDIYLYYSMLYSSAIADLIEERNKAELEAEGAN